MHLKLSAISKLWMYLKVLIFISGGSPIAITYYDHYSVEVHGSYSRCDKDNLGQDVRGIHVWNMHDRPR